MSEASPTSPGEQQLSGLQSWWRASAASTPDVARSKILSSIDPRTLAEIVDAGGTYHAVLTADRLSALSREFSNSTDPSLAPLARALKARGGYKAQARAVGTVFFKEARALWESTQGTAPFAPVQSPAPAVVSSATTAPASEPEADETWNPPRLFVASASYPSGCMMAARSRPHMGGDLVTNLPDGFKYEATGRAGDFLRVQLLVSGTLSTAYVPHTISGKVYLIEAPDDPSPAELLAPGCVRLDESWPEPRRYVPGPDYPEGARMAVKAAPDADSEQLGVLMPDHRYIATGRMGEFLQIMLNINGAPTAVYVPHLMGSHVVLVPETPEEFSAPGVPPPPPPTARYQEAGVADPSAASSWAGHDSFAQAAAAAFGAAQAASTARVHALEAKVEMQEKLMESQDLHVRKLSADLSKIAAELEKMRHCMSGVAAVWRACPY